MAKLVSPGYVSADLPQIALDSLAESLLAKETTVRGKTVVRHDPDKLIAALLKLQQLGGRGLVVFHSVHGRRGGARSVSDMEYR